MNQFKNGKTITSIISPGRVLSVKYRQLLQGAPERKVDLLYFNTPPVMPRSDLGAARTSFGFDCDHVSNPNQLYTNCSCENNSFSWKKNY